MSRLIDADALLERLNYQGRFGEDDEIYNLLTNAPTVQREGWVSVPIDPTEEMIELFFTEMSVLGYSTSKIDLTIDELNQCYKAMLSAAQKE